MKTVWFHWTIIPHALLMSFDPTIMVLSDILKKKDIFRDRSLMKKNETEIERRTEKRGLRLVRTSSGCFTYVLFDFICFSVDCYCWVKQIPPPCGWIVRSWRVKFEILRSHTQKACIHTEIVHQNTLPGSKFLIDFQKIPFKHE